MLSGQARGLIRAALFMRGKPTLNQCRSPGVAGSTTRRSAGAPKIEASMGHRLMGGNALRNLDAFGWASLSFVPDLLCMSPGPSLHSASVRSCPIWTLVRSSMQSASCLSGWPPARHAPDCVARSSVRYFGRTWREVLQLGRNEGVGSIFANME